MASAFWPRLILAFAWLLSAGWEAWAAESAGRAPLQIDQPSGFYDAPLALSAQSISGGQITFTTNGAAPTADSSLLSVSPIRIAGTTVLRMARFQDGVRQTPVQTRTYLFTSDIRHQTGAGFPSSWGLTNGQPVAAAYAMDPAIVDHASYRDRIEPALKALPSLSIVMEQRDLFDSQQGIYANPLESGPSWERPAAVELIYPDHREGFQINCGVRIQGGWNRRPEESPKHSFRLVFHSRHGAGRLRFPLFGSSGVAEFETLILRAGCNNTWLHWSGAERQHGEYIRDQWMRETLAAMGHLSARGFFVHLFLNGLYWGLYNLTERPSASFLAANFGGSPKNYDCRNGNHILEGSEDAWVELFRRANAGVDSPEQLESIANLLDLPQFIDFMILNLYASNADWDRSSNWYAGRRRKPPGKFQFFAWDGERTLERIDANTIDFDDDQSPPRLFQKLRHNAEFRMAFADRVQRHLFDQGALTPKAAAERFRHWSSRLDSAIVAESARWGGYRLAHHPYKEGPFERYTRDEFWRPEIERLLNGYFPERPGVFLRQLQAAGLYPQIQPPRIQSNGQGIRLSATEQLVYFTDDGSDPRLPGGKLAPQARRWEPGVELPDKPPIKARSCREARSALEWSALVALLP